MFLKTLQKRIFCKFSVFHNVHLAVSVDFRNCILIIYILLIVPISGLIVFQILSKNLFSACFYSVFSLIKISAHLVTLGENKDFSQCSHSISDVFHLHIFKMEFFLHLTMFGLPVFQIVSKKFICRGFGEMLFDPKILKCCSLCTGKVKKVRVQKFTKRAIKKCTADPKIISFFLIWSKTVFETYKKKLVRERF